MVTHLFSITVVLFPFELLRPFGYFCGRENTVRPGAVGTEVYDLRFICSKSNEYRSVHSRPDYSQHVQYLVPSTNYSIALAHCRFRPLMYLTVSTQRARGSGHGA
jgi:hypothetical protein